MTLKELLTTPHQNVKIGAGGGGFLYCGKVEGIDYDDLDKRNVIKRATSISESLSHIARIKVKMKDPVKAYERYEVNMLASNKDPVTYEEWTERQTSDMLTEHNNVNRNIAELIAYKKMCDRQVVDVYKSIDEYYTAIVIVEGTEKGSAWTTKEYEAIERSWHESIKG